MMDENPEFVDICEPYEGNKMKNLLEPLLVTRELLGIYYDDALKDLNENMSLERRSLL